MLSAIVIVHTAGSSVRCARKRTGTVGFRPEKLKAHCARVLSRPMTAVQTRKAIDNIEWIK